MSLRLPPFIFDAEKLACVLYDERELVNNQTTYMFKEGSNVGIQT